MNPLRIGISTCPNDTFAFHGLLSGQVQVRVPDEPTARPIEWLLDDVEALNQEARAGALDVAKLSFATLLDLPRDWVLLRAGSALGFGVGPVVLKRRGEPLPAEPRVWLPGAGTTAALLWETFHPGSSRVRMARFDRILPALLAGQADLGVCIHEGRFTFEGRGLELVEDLGATWEQATGLPLPLGGIAARAALGEPCLAAIDRALRASIELAHRDPKACLPTMRRHAAEFSDEVLFEHVRLYVNAATHLLDAAGVGALEALARRSGKPPLNLLPLPQ